MARQDTGPVRGLLLSGRRVDAGSKGWLRSVSNLAFDESGVAKPRPGFKQRRAATASSRPQIILVDRYNKRLVVAGLSSPTAVYVSTADDPGTSDWSILGQYGSSGSEYGNTIWSSGASVQNTVFFLYGHSTSDYGGLGRVDLDYSPDSWRAANVPIATSLKLVDNGTTGWLPANNQVAYRACFGFKYTNGRIILGAPSSRTIFVNDTANPVDIDVTCYLRRYVTESQMDRLGTDFFIQIYRTAPSGGVAVPPGDEMYLVYEKFLTSGSGTELSSPFTFIFTDRLSNGLGGQSLYTSPSQSGLESAHFPCPFASGTGAPEGGLAVYGGSLWACNYRPPGNTTVSLLAAKVASPGSLNTNELTYGSYTGDISTGSNLISNAGSSTSPFLRVGMYVEGAGIPTDTYLTQVQSTSMLMSNNATATTTGVTLTSGDVIQITSATTQTAKFWAASAESFAYDTGNHIAKFLLSSSATASTRIRDTVRSLVNAIHDVTVTATNPGYVIAHHISTDSEPPGKIYIQELQAIAGGGTFSCTSKPTAFSPSPPVTFESKADASIIGFSEPGQPEAWPPKNFLQTAAGATVFGFAVLRGAMLVATDRGLFRVVGTEGDFSIDLLDSSVVASGRVAGVEGSYAQFPVVDNTAYIMSVKGLVRATETATQLVGEEVAAIITPPDLDRHIAGYDNVNSLLFIPTGGATLVYHCPSGAWTIWNRILSSAVPVPWLQNTFFVWDDPASSYTGDIISYRSNLSEAASYYDTTSAVTVNSVSGTTTITLSATVPSATVVGDVIEQGANIGVITAINGATLTVVSNAGFGAGAATIYVGYTAYAEWCPIGKPGHIAKHYRYIAALFDGAQASPTVLNTLESDSYPKLFTFSYSTDKNVSASNAVHITTVPATSPYLVRNIIPQGAARCEVLVPKISWRVCRSVTRLLLLELDYVEVGDKT